MSALTDPSPAAVGDALWRGQHAAFHVTKEALSGARSIDDARVVLAHADYEGCGLHRRLLAALEDVRRGRPASGDVAALLGAVLRRQSHSPWAHGAVAVETNAERVASSGATADVCRLSVARLAHGRIAIAAHDWTPAWLGGVLHPTALPTLSSCNASPAHGRPLIRSFALRLAARRTRVPDSSSRPAVSPSQRPARRSSHRFRLAPERRRSAFCRPWPIAPEPSSSSFLRSHLPPTRSGTAGRARPWRGRGEA